MNNLRSILIDLHFLPAVGYLSLLNYADKVVFEAHEHYTKSSFRNRMHLLTANGVQRLSIPLKKGKNEQMPIREVRIAYEENWPTKHWRAIETAYRNAPYFDFYEADLKEIYFKKHELLFDWNLALLEYLREAIQLDFNWELSLEYQSQVSKPGIDLRNYMEPKKWNQAADLGIHLKPYPQVFQEKHGFISNLSSLDLLFCTGPEAISYLDASIIKLVQTDVGKK